MVGLEIWRDRMIGDLIVTETRFIPFLSRSGSMFGM